MSLKYNRFLLSAYLPLITVAMLSYTPAHAGFDWTPPKKVEATPLPTVTPEVVVSEDLGGKNSKVMVFEPEIFEAIEDEVEINKTAEEMLNTHVEHRNVEVIEEIGEEVIIESEENITQEEPEAFSLNPLSIEGNNIHGSDNNSEIVVLSSNLDDNASKMVEKVESEDAIIWEKTESFNIIEGFGSDMPLVLALRQIVPAKYAFSFGKDVNPGASLSWKGGKPWNVVLENALSSIGITYKLHGNKLKLIKIPNEEIIIKKNSKPMTLIKEGNISEKVNELLDIKQIDEADIYAPEIIELEKEIVKNKTTSLDYKKLPKREMIIDPGKSEAEQPNISESPKENSLLEEKKNEKNLKKALHLENDSAPEAVVDLEEEMSLDFIIEEVTSIDDPEIIEMEMPDNNEDIDIADTETIEDPIIITEESTVEESTKESPILFATQPSNIVKIWKAEHGEDLENILKSWSDEEGVELILNLSKNYKIDKDIFINGTFKNAIDILYSKGINNSPQYSLIETHSYKLTTND